MNRMRTMIAGITVAAGLAAGVVSMAAAAAAAPARLAAPAGHGTFSNWVAAQKSAGYALRKPGPTFGLRRGGITVAACGKDTYVSAVYRKTGSKSQLIFDQVSRDSKDCGIAGDGTFLGKFRVDGTEARLVGLCGTYGNPSCSAPDIGYNVIWFRHGVFYQIFSGHESRANVIAFARGLHYVN